ncbi:MAG: PAS domain-containing protein, partial [Hyphomicrobiales bacterium]
MHDHEPSGAPSRDGAAVAELAAALEDAPVLIWISGPDKRVTHFNRSWLEFTGRPLDDELGHGWMSGVHPDDVAAIETASDAAFARREPYQFEFRLRRRDGAWRWMLNKAAPRFAPDGRFTGYVGACTDITERKEVEAQARSSEERLQLAQEAAAVGTYDWDVQANLINWSPEMFLLHGIDPATSPSELYDVWISRLHPEDRERADEETRQFVESADGLSIEFRVVHPDGSVRWIQGRGRMIRDRDGRPIRMIGVNFDVTERKQAEEALRQSEQRIRDIAENFPGIIFRRVTYPDGRIEYPYFSGADEHVFHIPREQFADLRTMEDVAKLIHYDDLAEMLDKFQQAAAALTPLETEGRIVAGNGETRWVRSISRPRPGEDGALIWDGVLLDVTDQHRREGERERTATMLRMGMEVAGIGTWEIDPATVTTVGSPVTNAMFGFAEDDQPRLIDDYLKAVHPDDVERVRQSFGEAAALKTNTSLEYRVRKPDGTTCWVASRGAYMRLADGTERLLGALFDITDRKRQEEEREAALDHQQTLLRELNHRIKNNLQMITSVLQLQSARVSDPEQRQQFNRVVERVQTIADLHTQFGTEDRVGQIEFGNYLQQLCERLRSSVLADRPVEIVCRADACMIELDRGVPLGLIVNELVTNAIKYAFPGDASGTITIELRRQPDDTLVLSVGDSGTGLPDESERRRGLGTILVEGLGRQVGATIEQSG